MGVKLAGNRIEALLSAIKKGSYDKNDYVPVEYLCIKLLEIQVLLLKEDPK